MRVHVEYLAMPESFEAFCERHNIQMVVKERSIEGRRTTGSRWYATPQRLVEVMADGFLTSVHGNGDTPGEAVLDYARRIRGCKLVRNAGSDERYEFQAPSDWEPS